MAKAILRKTHQSAGVKIYGASTETIDLSVDLLLAAGEVLAGATQTVNISQFKWTGEAASTITITRNSIVIAKVDAGDSGEMNFAQSEMIENIQNTQDIVVTITGVAQLWITLRKVSGYATTREYEQFGSADNPAVAGS